MRDGGLRVSALGDIDRGANVFAISAWADRGRCRLSRSAHDRLRRAASRWWSRA